MNRNLRLDSIGAIGFDLDYTLAHYDPIPVERLAFRLTQEKLVAKRGYAKEVLALEYDPSFVIRGLVIDRLRGNSLKMDYYSYVARAYHGRRMLDTEERKRIYRRRRIRLSYDAFVSVDTLFHLPEVYLYLALVDLAEAARDGRRGIDYNAIYADVREMIDEAHADMSIKSRIMKAPERFIREDPLLAATLDEMRRSGKKLFLLTNSEMYYTDALMTHLFRKEKNGRSSWKEFFDLIIVSARKPAFFLGRSGGEGRAQKLEDEGTNPPVYAGGDAVFLEKELGFRGDQVLYFGDHTYGDILRSKKNLGWRTAMIVSELAHEIETTEANRAAIRRLEEFRRQIESLTLEKATAARDLRLENGAARGDGRRPGRSAARDAIRARITSLDGRISGVRARMETLQKSTENAYNPHWGPLFHEGNETSRFAHQVRDFACLYTSRVSNFLNYPMDHYFPSRGALMPHEL